MKSPHATTTPDLLGDTCDLAGERPPMKSKAATRLAKMREAKGLKGLTVNIDGPTVDAFHAKRKRQGKTANEVVEKLIKSQYLRDR